MIGCDYLKKANKIISIILMLLIILSIATILYLNISNAKAFTLVSNSMEPSLKEGSLLFNKKVAFEKIEIGDIITYKMKNSDIYVTHRVNEIDEENQRLLCKGDANKDVDSSFIGYDQYQGSLQYYIPMAGYIVMFMHGTFGRILGLILVFALLISVGYDLYRKKNVPFKKETRVV